MSPDFPHRIFDYLVTVFFFFFKVVLVPTKYEPPPSMLRIFPLTDESIVVIRLFSIITFDLVILKINTNKNIEMQYTILVLNDKYQPITTN